MKSLFNLLWVLFAHYAKWILRFSDKRFRLKTVELNPLHAFFRSSEFFFCPLLGRLDIGAGVEQPFGCLVVQNRQAVQSVVGRWIVQWRTTWSTVCSASHSQAAEEAIPHLYRQERKRLTPVRRRLSRTQALLGRVIPRGYQFAWKRRVPLWRYSGSLLLIEAGRKWHQLLAGNFSLFLITVNNPTRSSLGSGRLHRFLITFSFLEEEHNIPDTLTLFCRSAISTFNPDEFHRGLWPQSRGDRLLHFGQAKKLAFSVEEAKRVRRAGSVQK